MDLDHKSTISRKRKEHCLSQTPIAPLPPCRAYRSRYHTAIGKKPGEYLWELPGFNQIEESSFEYMDELPTLPMSSIATTERQSPRGTNLPLLEDKVRTDFVISPMNPDGDRKGISKKLNFDDSFESVTPLKPSGGDIHAGAVTPAGSSGWDKNSFLRFAPTPPCHLTSSAQKISQSRENSREEKGSFNTRCVEPSQNSRSAQHTAPQRAADRHHTACVRPSAELIEQISPLSPSRHCLPMASDKASFANNMSETETTREQEATGTKTPELSTHNSRESFELVPANLKEENAKLHEQLNAALVEVECAQTLTKSAERQAAEVSKELQQTTAEKEQLTDQVKRKDGLLVRAAIQCDQAMTQASLLQQSVTGGQLGGPNEWPRSQMNTPNHNHTPVVSSAVAQDQRPVDEEAQRRHQRLLKLQATYDSVRARIGSIRQGETPRNLAAGMGLRGGKDLAPPPTPQSAYSTLLPSQTPADATVAAVGPRVGKDLIHDAFAQAYQPPYNTDPATSTPDPNRLHKPLQQYVEEARKANPFQNREEVQAHPTALQYLPPVDWMMNKDRSQPGNGQPGPDRIGGSGATPSAARI